MHGQYIPIPFELIGKPLSLSLSFSSSSPTIQTNLKTQQDLTASFIASLISGNDFILVTPPLGDSLQSFRENVNFIRKTLRKAQISCSSLICSLWYIDQYFHNNSSSKKKNDWNPRDLFIASIVVADKYL